MCLVQENSGRVFIREALFERLLLRDHCNVSCWDRARDGCKKARSSTVRLSFQSHYFFLVLFDTGVEQSNEVFAEVHHFRLVETVL